MRPHREQPTRLPCPWDSPGKNTGVGCHFLLQCMKVKRENEVTPSCLTLSEPMDCSLPGSSIHGIFQAKVLAMDHSPPGSSIHGILHDKNTGVGCHFLLQGIFLTQGSNPGLLLLHWKVNSLPLCHLLYHSLFLSNMVFILAISKLILNILITFLDYTAVK